MNSRNASILRERAIRAVEEALDRMASNAASAIARRVHAAAVEGRPIEDAEQLVREILAAELCSLTAGLAFALDLNDKATVV